MHNQGWIQEIPRPHRSAEKFASSVPPMEAGLLVLNEYAHDPGVVVVAEGDLTDVTPSRVGFYFVPKRIGVTAVTENVDDAILLDNKTCDLTVNSRDGNDPAVRDFSPSRSPS